MAKIGSPQAGRNTTTTNATSSNATKTNNGKIKTKRNKVTGQPLQELDAAMVSELYDSIEKHPPGIEAKRILAEWYLAAGWMDSAVQMIEELRTLVPYDNQIKAWHRDYCEDKSDESEPSGSEKDGSSSKRKEHERKLSYISVDEPQASNTTLEKTVDFAAAKADFEQSVTQFKERSKRLQFFMQLQQHIPDAPDFNAEMSTLKGFIDGKLNSTLRTLPNHKLVLSTAIAGRPESAMAIVKKLKKEPQNAFRIVMEDFDAFIKWQRLQPGVKKDEDSLKSALVARRKMIDADITDELKIHTAMAMMHLDREIFKRKYVNDETMLGDEIADISRENFYSTEDGYAWDMEELAQAIKSNDGVMRNPLSKHMFTPADIRAITIHPAGKALKALQVEQSQLRKGIRPKTIEEMTKLSKAFLEDMDDDGVKSRKAADEFMAYVATLPDSEQKALDCLKVPARDTHTGMAYDATIGEAMRDAMANKLCFHKAGDFIGQAATHLKNNR